MSFVRQAPTPPRKCARAIKRGRAASFYGDAMKAAEALSLSSDLTILGLALRTRPEDAAQDIPALWQRFFAEGVPGKLPALGAEVYALYCDYEGDHRGAYTLVLGVAVAPDAELPAGMRRVRIPAGRFARFAVSGDPAQVVWQAWSHINGAWANQGERRYTVDFERYTKLAPGDVTAEICVGLLAR